MEKKKECCALRRSLLQVGGGGGGGGGEDERNKNVLLVVVADGLAGAVGAPWAFDDCCPDVEEIASVGREGKEEGLSRMR